MVLALSGLLARAEDPPVIQAGCEYAFPPFCTVDQAGLADGFSVRLLEAALATMGRQVVFKVGLWADLRQQLEQGALQVLPVVGRTPEREAIYDFTFPYMTLHGVIVVRQDSTGIDSLADLQGHQVGVMRADNSEEFMRRAAPEVSLQLHDTHKEALAELAAGKHDAVVIQRLTAVRLIAEHGWENLRIVETAKPLYTQEFCFAVREGDSELLAVLNEGLAQVMANGTFRTLHTQWFAALELPAQRRIIVGGDNNRPPFEFLDADGQPTGFSVELTQAIARHMGLDIEIRLSPWAATERSLATGEVDLMQYYYYSPQRDRVYDYSNVYSRTSLVAVMRRGAGNKPKTLADLVRLEVVVEAGKLAHELLGTRGRVRKLTLATNAENALATVHDGEYDCAVLDLESAMYWINHHQWANLEVGTAALQPVEASYAARPNRQAHLALFDEGLKHLQSSGEYRRIYSKWLGIYESPNITWLSVLRYSGWVLGPLVFLLLLVLAWNRLLHRQVASRTEKLRQSEEFVRAILDHVPIGVAVNSIFPAVEFQYFNAEFARCYGVTAADLSRPDGFWEAAFPDPEQRAALRQRVEADIASGDHARMAWTDVPIMHPGAPTRYISARNVMLTNGSLTVSVVWDVTERKLADFQRDQLLQAIEQANDTIIITDFDGRVIYVNPAFTQTSGYTRDEAIGQAIDTLRSGAYEAELLASIWADLRAGKTWTGRIKNARKDGQAYTEAATISPVRDGSGKITCFVAVKRDITEHLQLEAQLRQAQKMESVGRLAGGVAHDFNNMLTVILGHVELALNHLPDHDPMHRRLGEVRKAAQRSADLTRQLLAFARKQTISPQVLDLNQTIEGLLKMLQRLLGEDLDLHWQPGYPLSRVKLDPSQLDQVLANLCVNARDAITSLSAGNPGATPGLSGKVTISTSETELDAAYCLAHEGALPGRFVVMTVGDSGCGMSKEVMAHLFEPFFTTKEVGKGTGLGLATVYGIMRQNGGFIAVYSEVGQGTTFRLYFPAHEGPVEAASDTSTDNLPRGRGETVMLVEDDASILSLTENMLNELGYRVLPAQLPEQALAMAKLHAGKIDLLLTDVVMPRMNGRQLAEAIRASQPQLKCLYMSGYTADIVAHHGVLDEGVQFIQKPFTLKVLASKIREVLA